jgi:phage shock protein PspC (stress-responsive transcriptional regulator)
MSGNVFMRDDTFFGVCEALGEDFGFNSNWLRLVFGVSLLWNPTVVVAAYLGLGVLVAFSRLIVRNPRPAPAVAAEAGQAPAAAPAAEAEAEAEAQPQLPLAA